MGVVELLSDGSELFGFEERDLDAAPFLRCADDGGIHELEQGTFAEGWQ